MYTKAKQRWLEIQAEEEALSDEEESMPINKKKGVPLWKRLNKDGYTPLTLAAHLGQAEMFSFLLEERKITQWSYGPVSCVLYPLDQVDLEFQEDVRNTRSSCRWKETQNLNFYVLEFRKTHRCTGNYRSKCAC